MSDKDKENNLNDSNEQDPNNIQVYENDEAYMFGDENSNEDSNNNDDGLLQEKDLQIPSTQIDQNNNNNNNINSKTNPNGEINNNLNNNFIQNSEENDDTIRNKLSINNNNNNNNNNENNMNSNNNNIQNENNEGEENEEMENEENENPEEDSEGIPLITLKFISICQCCKNAFNSTINIPYLFKCGHFFCKKCIDENFTDEEGIKCPNDGLVAYSINELKLLNNLITDKNVETQRNFNGNFCDIHKGQKLTHYIEDTKELICVYCAFSRFKKNPKIEIKEIKDKLNDISVSVDNVIEDNQHNVELIQGNLKDIKKNKETEEKRVNTFFETILNNLLNKKNEILNQIDSLFTENARKLSQKLEIFSSKIEQSENLKNFIDEYLKNDSSGNLFPEILDNFNKLSKENNDGTNIQLQEYRFSHDDDTKINKFINNFGDLKVINKNHNFKSGKDEIDFKFKNIKVNTSMNNINLNNNHNNHNLSNITNDILNNSDFNINNNNYINNSTFDIKNNNNNMNNNNMNNNLAHSVINNNQNGARNKIYNQGNKNFMGGKFSYNKPMTPGNYRTDFIGSGFKSFNFK